MCESAFTRWLSTSPPEDSFSPIDLINCGEEVEISFSKDEGGDPNTDDSAAQANAKTFAYSIMGMNSCIQDIFLCGTETDASNMDQNARDNIPWDEADKESIPPFVKESIKKAEEVLSQSNYGLAPLRKSLQHAEMIVSASSFGFSKSANKKHDVEIERDSTNAPTLSKTESSTEVERVIETKSSDLSSAFHECVEHDCEALPVQEEDVNEDEEQELLLQEEKQAEPNPTKKDGFGKKSKKHWFWKSGKTKQMKPTKTVKRILTILHIKSDRIEVMIPSSKQ